MAWNRPTSNTVDTTSSLRPTGRGKMPRLRRGLLAGVIVVLGAGIAAWLLTNGEAPSSSLQKKERGLIKEVTPAASPANASPVKVEAKAEKPKGFKSKYSSRIFKTEGEMKAWEAENVVHPGVKTGKKPMPTINYVESEIHHIVNSNPRDPYLETPLPTKHFNEQMMQALMHKMEADEDDTPERKEQIRRVEEAKAFLRQELKKGRDLRTVLLESKAEMRKAADEVKFLQDELKRASREEGATLEDMQDMEKAANKMLSDRGIDATVKMSGKDRIRLQGGLKNLEQSKMGKEPEKTEGAEK